ncbi:DUF6404 family protein [Cohaesibacter intestini]|uniref:DUF6404 family protein n=1 Tax=Cohaesibacter intestini TaxID=2211145 RepID=UPI000DEBE1D8|nr:DUF6404 family protein [Cohaesibacter intestini]
MTFDDHYQLAMTELQGTEILRDNYAPPLHKLLLRLGFSMRPPHYASMPVNMLTTGIPFGILWSGLMWLFVWEDQIGMTVSIALWAGFFAGMLFGIGMAIYYRAAARKHGLSSWPQLAMK